MAGNGIIRVLWYLHEGGGEYSLDYLFSFLLSVAAGVVTHYICKWLDRE